MDGNEIRPEKYIDREWEQEEFRTLLKLEDDARLFTICDSGGRGKSSLLRRLRYNCDWVYTPTTPNSLIALDQLQTNDPSPFALVEQIRNDLVENHDLAFPTFDVRRKDLSLRASYVPALGSGSAYGTIQAEGAQIGGSGNILAANNLNLPNVQQLTVNLTDPNAAGMLSRTDRDESRRPDLDENARRECIEGFFQDLKQICDQQPIVILLDAFERDNEKRKDWILRRFLRPLVFEMATRPRYLVVVLAGRELPDFRIMLNEQRWRQLVRSIASLAFEWNDEHVRAFLELHGFTDLNDSDIQFVRNRIQTGRWSLEEALKKVTLLS